MHNIAFEALYLPFISPNLAALLIGQSLEAGLSNKQDVCFAQEPEKRSFTLGTPSSPYDATRNGPLCPSAGRTAEDADRIRDTNITEAVANLAESALV